MDEKDYQAFAAVLAPVIKRQIDAATAPLEAQIQALEARAPLQGEPGPTGKDGPSEETVTDMVARAVAALPPAAAGESGRDGKDADQDSIIAAVQEAVLAKVAEIPIPKDGAPGAAGKDGVGLAGAVIDRAGDLVVTLTDGSQKALGPVVGKDGSPGLAGKDGADALGFDDLSIEFDGERAFKFVLARGEVRKEFGPFTAPWPLYRGVYSEGTEYKAGDTVTWGGSLHIAQQDTADKPETAAWKLCVKRGRDGRDGVLKSAAAPKPVSIAG